eukprot:EG_transcript_680
MEPARASAPAPAAPAVVQSCPEFRRPASVRPKKCKSLRKATVRRELLDNPNEKVIVGVCAMAKKVNAKPMRAILGRLESAGDIRVERFGDKVILEDPIETWPRVDALIAFCSDGFPYEKALKYVELRKPFLINDLQKQYLLFDRRLVYQTLVKNGVQVPKHIIVNRDTLMQGQDPEGFIERENYVELNGVRIEKPFVEKPCDADDHNINIYYPSSMGGGVKRLFRKVGDKSAEYDPYHPGTVRRDGSYIYEQFVATGGTDIKVYTVGPRYAHAEARKSPVVDGKVIRTGDGKEMRFPVLLSPAEKEIARMVSLIFRQKVCGFDLLRCRSKSYVCDVNGWSFVKNSGKYYADTAIILRNIVFSALSINKIFRQLNVSEAMRREAEEFKYEFGTGETNLDEPIEHSDRELRCVLAIVRHGDRTPKQKMKMIVTQPPLIALMEKHLDVKGKQAKLKAPSQLQELLDITRRMLEETRRDMQAAETKEEQDALLETSEKLRYMRAVLEQGTFSGVNRKAQLKPIQADKKQKEKEREAARAEDAGSPLPPAPDGNPVPREGSELPGAAGLAAAADPPAKPTEEGAPDAKPEKPEKPEKTDKADKAEKGEKKKREVLLVLKHGGVLTHSGRQQAEQLGKEFRTVLYPSNLRGGLLRLHSTYRHDLKIYSSDEGRVQSSAAAFTQGLLDLEGASLTPILVSLIKKDASMLETFGKGANADIQAAKALLYQQLTYDPAADQTFSIPVPLPERTEAFEFTDSEAVRKRSRCLANDDEDSVSETGKHTDANPSSEEFNKQMGSLLSVEDPTYGMDPKPFKGGEARFHRMSDQTLAHCQEMVGLLKNLVQEIQARLRLEREVEKGTDKGTEKEAPVDGDVKKAEDQAYSALVNHPSEWDVKALNEFTPCMSEKLILIYDRWRKLLKGFYNEKKSLFDCSKIPDVYDSVKYDMIHNQHLGFPLERLYAVSRKLANCVIPNEYGTDVQSKRRIGARICSRLLGKLLNDLDFMVDESVAASAGLDMTLSDDVDDTEPSHQNRAHTLERQALEVAYSFEDEELDSGRSAGGDGEEEDEENDSDDEVTRLSPEYASGIEHPMRHVRTRLYFTSESHIHALVNVFRYAHVDRPELEEGPTLVGPEGLELLSQTPELDYLSNIVLRLWEMKTCALDDPERFQVEAMFSPGALYDGKAENHCLPPVQHQPLHPTYFVNLKRMHQLLEPFSTPCKRPAAYWKVNAKPSGSFIHVSPHNRGPAPMMSPTS